MNILNYKKSLIAVAILAIVLSGLLFFSRLISTTVTRYIVKKKLAELTLKFDDGLYAVLCGTGSPMPDIERVGPCIAVVAGGHLYIVDAGDGSARNIMLAGLQVGEIDAILLTHFHSDHIASLGDIMLQRWANGSTDKPVDVIGPQGVESVVNGFNLAYKLDSGYRIAHHGAKTLPPSGAGGIARPFTLSAREDASAVVINKDGIKITAFKVNHNPVSPAVGYRFDYKGRSLVISGDTAYSVSLLQYSKNADLLLHEALQTSIVKMINEQYRNTSNTTLSKITADIPSYHSTPEDASRIAKEANVKYLILYHIVPPLPSCFILHNIFLGDAKKYYNGPIKIGVDGLMVSLPPDSMEIKVKKIF